MIFFNYLLILTFSVESLARKIYGKLTMAIIAPRICSTTFEMTPGRTKGLQKFAQSTSLGVFTPAQVEAISDCAKQFLGFVNKPLTISHETHRCLPRSIVFSGWYIFVFPSNNDRNLGEGAVKVAKLVYNLLEATMCCDAQIKVGDNELIMECVLNALKIHSKLQHTNATPKLVEVFRDKDIVHWISELAPFGNLADVMRTDRLTIKDKWEITAEIFHTIGKFHENGVLHNDVKAENLVLSRKGGSWVVQLIDLDWSRTMDDRSINADWAVCHYNPPERIRALVEFFRERDKDAVFSWEKYWEAYNQKMTDTIDMPADIYQAGLVIFFLFIGRHPFFWNFGSSKKHWMFTLDDWRRIEFSNDHCSSRFMRLISKVTRVEPKLRWTARHGYQFAKQVLAEIKASRNG